MSSVKAPLAFEGSTHTPSTYRRRAKSSLVAGFILIVLSTVIASRSFTPSWQWMNLWDAVEMMTPVPGSGDFDWATVRIASLRDARVCPDWSL